MSQHLQAALLTNPICMRTQSQSISLQPPWTAARQAPLSMGFPRQGYWSGLPFPSLGDLPHLGIELVSLVSPALTGRFFTTGPPRKPY